MNPLANQIEMPDSWSDPLREEAEKVKYPRALALRVAAELCDVLRPLCQDGDDGRPLLKVCGSLRRMKDQVGDVELVFVPRMSVVAREERDLFQNVIRPAKTVLQTHPMLDALVSQFALSRRLKSGGSQTWGQWIRLAVHVASQVPVDFFACTREAWWNIVACRTGGARSNVAVASAAIAKGWHWDMSPQSPGFKRRKGLSDAFEWHPVTSEAEVFEFVGLPCLKPEERA
jgi:DNA polymerase/3'-5' exonuclease PolX